jgi:iron complex outermembrane receptor protein
MITAKANTRLAMAIALALGSAATAPVAGAAEPTAGTLEEITVTARKRVENLQDVGTSISALSSAELERRFDSDLQSMANVAPNLIIHDIQQGPGSPAAISMRGVGTTDVEKNFDPTVGVVVDGIFIGVNSGAMIKALDIESIEVLRGPQGTLFGRNSIGGVINVLRGKPGFDGFGGAVRAGAGNNGDMQFDGYINVPVNDKFAFKLGGAIRENDGWFYNRTLDRDVGKTEFQSVSPAFTFRPTDNLEIYYRFDKTWQDQDANTTLNMAQPDQLFCIAYGQCAQGVQSPQSGDRYTVLQNGDGSADGEPYQTYFDSELHIATINWSLNDQYTVDYVFGDFSTEEEVYQDWDGTSLTLYHTDRPATWNQQSHELRLTFEGDRLSYTAGLYYWESDYRIDLYSYIGFGDILFGLPPGTVLEVPQTVVQNTESTAIFFEGDYKINDAWTLTLGGRYTEDEKDSGLIDPSMPELAVEGGLDNPFKKDWSEFTPKASLRYRLNEDVMLYGLYSKGFRAGGFSGRPGTYVAASIPYDPETVDNYELGWKTTWMDGRLRLNGSVFFMKYDDKQEEQSVPTAGGTGQQTIVVNASSVDIMGLELDFAAVITDNFTLSANLGLLDAEYQSLVDPGTDIGPGDDRDLTYLKLRRAPEYTATISPTYTFDALGGTFTLHADFRMVDDQELTFLNSPQGQAKAHETIDASLSYRFGETTIALWGMNLTDDDTWTQAYDVGTSLDFAGLWTYATARPPRTYGLRLSHNF